MNQNKPNMIIYNTVDGKASVALYARDGMLWMNQNQIAELFDTSVPNVSMHISNILKEKELEENSVVKNYLTTATDGKNYNVTFYALDMILAIGFRVRSKRGTQFRIWANQNLKEYMIKGFVMDDERLKNPDGRPDYFLETAELRAKNRYDLTMKFWQENVDRILENNDKKVLTHRGKISNAEMEQMVRKAYTDFDERRKAYDAQLADEQDWEELKQLEQKIQQKK